MNSVGLPVVCGTASIVTPPRRCSTPSTRSVGKNRSATNPRKNGAAMAAIGFTVYGQCVRCSMPVFAMYTAIVVYQEPQAKNSRNIIRLRRPFEFRIAHHGSGTGGGRGG